ncbi:hypothetical protein [Flavobacterium noncentrifugens]|uniref:hypothetical protein n=1 Tax=Flavobacterium noncentrifugens TaxID=1128970 RepID=UPI000B89E81F|nr:hypothetical protein [Flavobacterium noncentrifugens]
MNNSKKYQKESKTNGVYWRSGMTGKWKSILPAQRSFTDAGLEMTDSSSQNKKSCPTGQLLNKNN